MTRIVVFTCVMIGFALVMSLDKYESFKVNNEKFSYEKAKKGFLAHQAELAALEEAKKPKKEEEIAVEAPQYPVLALDTPELQAGAKLYKKCVACHGKNGEGKKSQKAPAIGGQFDWYIKTQIVDMKSGKRSNPIMNPYIKKLSDQDIDNLSHYISKLTWKLQ